MNLLFFFFLFFLISVFQTEFFDCILFKNRQFGFIKENMFSIVIIVKFTNIFFIYLLLSVSINKWNDKLFSTLGKKTAET